MKEELEVKILEIDPRKIMRRVEELGGVELFDGDMVTASYDFSSADGTPLWLNCEDEAGRLLYVNHKLLQFHETRVTDYEDMRCILREIGLESRENAYFPRRRTDSIEGQGKRLRLRTKGTYGELTLKKNVTKEDVKRALEYETRVHDPKACRRVLLWFGMREGQRYEKHRTEALLANDVKIALDTINGIPPFVEVEGPTVEAIENTVIALGFTMTDTNTMSGRELRKHYGVR